MGELRPNRELVNESSIQVSKLSKPGVNGKISIYVHSLG